MTENIRILFTIEGMISHLLQKERLFAKGTPPSDDRIMPALRDTRSTPPDGAIPHHA